MKKLVVLLGLLLAVSCYEDTSFEISNIGHLPENLIIENKTGIRLEDYIVEDEVRVNIKLPKTETYRVKILDIDSKIVSQEKLRGIEGNNILKVYVKSLPESSFTLSVEDLNGTKMGTDVFSKI
jgi:hypothetical protein